MEPMVLILLLLGIALLLGLAEGILPTHGLLGVAGFVSALAAIAVGFTRSPVTGVALAAGVLLATPVVAMTTLKVWQSSPLGRKLTLAGVAGRGIEHEPIRVGDQGVTATALRPMGQAEFGPVSVSVQSRLGRPIPSGTRVRVTHYDDGIATVEPIDALV